MPFIQIKSLPFEDAFDVSEAVLAITKDFSEGNDIPAFHVHTTWEFYLPGHYAKGEAAPDYHPVAVQPPSHPLIVDLLTPDFNDADTIEKMLVTLANSIANHAPVSLDRIFINHRQARSGMVFDDGKVVKW